MSKDAYIGVNNIAQKIDKAYIGIDDIARQIIKGYIGVNGVARTFFEPQADIPIAGGSIASNIPLDTIDVYSDNLTLSNDITLSEARRGLASTSNSNYAIFAGGLTSTSGSSYTSTVDAFNGNLSRSTINLSTPRYDMAPTSIGNYCLFAGGRIPTSGVVDVIDNNLTCTVATSLSVARRIAIGASTSDYAFIAGGYNSNIVDAYDSNLVQFIPATLPSIRLSTTACGGSTDNYAFVIGGSTTTTGGGTKVYCYDNNLVMTTADEMDYMSDNIACISIENYIVAGCGGYYVDIYDQNLTKTLLPESQTTWYNEAKTANAGNYGIVSGASVNTLAYKYNG